MRRTLIAVSLCVAAPAAAACSLTEAGEATSGGPHPDDAMVSLDSGRSDTSLNAEASRPVDAAHPMDSTSGMDSTPDHAETGVDAMDAREMEVGFGDASVQNAQLTFYGWDDNTPPGTAIAYPMDGGFPTKHNAAGGVGSYTDPITMATSAAEIPIGTIVYVPFLKKYVVMEDDSNQCDMQWSKMSQWHVVVWMNSDGTEMPPKLTMCEAHWAQTTTTIVIGPPSGLAVDTTPLFDPSTNACLP
jgi:hypothetical protein